MLPSNLPVSSVKKFDKRADLFFKSHLKWTLGVNFLAGDILDQYPDRAQSLIDHVYSPESNINAPLWDTPLGKDILGQLIVYK